jgi:DNA-directed RNA polymerase specialized sigma24 family protein
VTNLNPSDGLTEFHREMLAIANDPGVKSLAKRHGGDRELAEDVIQESLYAVIRISDPDRIEDRRAYFCTVVIHAADRLRRVSGTTLLDDLETALRTRRGRSPAPRSLEQAAVFHLMVQTWLARLVERKTQLRETVPGRSADPDRYRDLIVTIAEPVLLAAAHGEASTEDSNPALQARYPEWFAEPGCAENSCHQRLSRARADLRVLLQKVVTHDELLPLDRIRWAPKQPDITCCSSGYLVPAKTSQAYRRDGYASGSGSASSSRPASSRSAEKAGRTAVRRHGRAVASHDMAVPSRCQRCVRLPGRWPKSWNRRSFWPPALLRNTEKSGPERVWCPGFPRQELSGGAGR